MAAETGFHFRLSRSGGHSGYRGAKLGQGIMAPVQRKVWITRTRPAAEATAERVRALGHKAFVIPLLEVRAVDPGPLRLEGVGALAFTSANAVRAFADSTADRSLKVFAVGAATAQAARAVGFKTVLSTEGGVSVLARALADRRRHLNGEVLHPGAAEPAGDLVGDLARHGVPARSVTLYETLEAELTAEDLAVLPDLDDVLIHSAKAAKALAKVLRGHPAPRLRAIGLSKAALAPLARSPLSAKLAAPNPLEADLLNLIHQTP
jgi:uroporphyrinogen-III synthase